MPQRRRTSAACLLLLLVAAVFGPAASASASASVSAVAPALAAAAAASPAPAAKPLEDRDHRPDGTYAVPRADPRDSGGSCRPLDAPLKGTDAVVAHGHTDPLTAAGTARSPLPRTPQQRIGVPRAPPAAVAGAAELLPVLRI